MIPGTPWNVSFWVVIDQHSPVKIIITSYFRRIVTRTEIERDPVMLWKSSTMYCKKNDDEKGLTIIRYLVLI